ncbi:MAG: VOC family protein [Candidatus Aminicenantes bacterium]|nr:VOC family protein [Candidatus Aminicenantes bacterium]
MMKNIDHIAIKVSDLILSCQALENLGLTCKSIEQYNEVSMQIAFLSSPNNKTTLELLAVTDPSSPIANDPAGLHHIGLKVENIEKIYKMMKGDKRYKLEGDIRKGSHSRIFFFRIKDQEETLFECVE